MKGIICLLILATIAQNTQAQRVKRKGTTPIQMNKDIKNNENAVRGNFTLEQIQGKWQEHGRIATGSTAQLSYKDTLMINIVKTSAEVREGMSMNMKGEASINDGDNLNVAGDTYTIKSVANNQMILDDGEYLKTMQRVSTFYLELVGKDSVKKAAYNNGKNINLADLKGKWIVYRRQAKPGKITNDTELVKSISIDQVDDSTKGKGEIVVYKNDLSEKLDCVFTIVGNTINVVSNNRKWTFTTYKAENNEFVFGQTDDLLYYAKSGN